MEKLLVRPSSSAYLCLLMTVLHHCTTIASPDFVDLPELPAPFQHSVWTPASDGMETKGSVTVEEDGSVKVYTLKRGAMEVKVMDYGAIVTSVKVPDARGAVDDVVLGFDKPAPYMDGTSSPYFGAIVGRVANRIAGASFELDGEVYSLYANDGPNTLHGGLVGFDKVHWRSKASDGAHGPALKLDYASRDGEEGFPGSLDVTVTYSLPDDGEMRIEMTARASGKATPVNLASHTYWNLAGHGSGDILEHEMQIFASFFTPVDDLSIPTGEIVSVRGTPFDFLEAETIGARIDEVPGPAPGGYDHNYVLEKEGEGLKRAARVVDPISGRVMELFTDAPGVQFYTSNYVDNVVGKGGAVYNKHSAFCLETQGFPNAINEPKFPSVVVQPGETYRHVMVHKFSTI